MKEGDILSRTYWMNAGFCVDCGREVEMPNRYVRCNKCRAHILERMKKQKAIQGERKDETITYIQPEIEKCIHCVWGNITDSIVVCAFPYCVRNR